jgi:hypothetical protein
MLRLHDDAAFLTDYSLRDGKPHLLDAPVSGGVVAAGVSWLLDTVFRISPRTLHAALHVCKAPQSVID